MTWSIHLEAFTGLLALLGAYVLGVGPLRRRYRWAAEGDSRRCIIFLSGILVAMLAEASPLHHLSERYLFSAHMVQHLLLIMVAAPLFLLGTPSWLIRPWLRVPALASALRLLTRPVMAIIIFSAVLVFWHLPPFYESALHFHWAHFLEHLTFTGGALLMWWPVFSPLPELPRLSYPLQMLYLFVQSLVPGVLGAVITFSGVVLYPLYASAPRIWGISALLDQQIGGLIMKIVGSVVLWLLVVLLFFRWYNREEALAKNRELTLPPWDEEGVRDQAVRF